MYCLNNSACVLLLVVSASCVNGFVIPSSSIITKTSTSSSSLNASAAAVANDSSDVSTAVEDGKPKIEDEISLDSIRLNVNEKARTVASVCTSGTLCTLMGPSGGGGVDIEGSPFGSFVDYVLDDDGNPVFLMNEMSMHTINIRDNPKVTLFAQLGTTKVLDNNNSDNSNSNNRSNNKNSNSSNKGQDVSRCSITGMIQQIDPKTATDIDSIRMRYSIEHTYADQVMDSPKFAFYRLIPSSIYFVGGFGVLSKWVDVDSYKNANPDILAKEASSILSKLNSNEHSDDLILTAKHLLDVTTDITDIRVTSIDRLGVDIRVTATAQEGTTRRNKVNTDEYRIGFRLPVISIEDAKSEVLKVFQEAWEKGNDYDYGDDNTDDEYAPPGSSVPIMKIAADSLE